MFHKPFTNFPQHLPEDVLPSFFANLWGDQRRSNLRLHQWSSIQPRCGVGFTASLQFGPQPADYTHFIHNTYIIYIYIYNVYIIIWLLIKIPLSGNGHSSRIKMLLSRNFRAHPYLSFAEPMFSKAIMISNFRETSAQKNVTFANSKQTFARVSNITCTVFAIKTVYKDL